MWTLYNCREDEHRNIALEYCDSKMLPPDTTFIILPHDRKLWFWS